MPGGLIDAIFAVLLALVWLTALGMLWYGASGKFRAYRGRMVTANIVNIQGNWRA